MFRFEIHGLIEKGGDYIKCKIITPPCENAYQARMYAIGKYGTDFIINYDEIFLILD